MNRSTDPKNREAAKNRTTQSKRNLVSTLLIRSTRFSFSFFSIGDPSQAPPDAVPSGSCAYPSWPAMLMA